MVEQRKQVVRRRKLSDEVTDLLLQRIKNDKMKPGDLLPSERQLMEDYGVGRPAIREALQNLDSMGIVSISHGERSRVAEPDFESILERLGHTTRHMLVNSPRTLDELKHARLVFEMGLVREAARRARDGDVQRLRRRLEEQTALVEQPSEFMRADMAFHREIAEIAGNPILVTVSQAIFDWLIVFHTELVRAPGAESLTLQEHADILAAIEARDPDAAERALYAHLTRANGLYQFYEAQRKKTAE
ncbi:transcriptional regulator NanR [Telmatospirillum sp. J64-1]|uniref:transcriptional regulator NanR n=1 Tax=Telmatospirillum sp. J64-1 TaxID=2502183 RepID=UPI001C8F8A05|nr:transcriptional regulator NanR [Telmatospirillum sp. J64-1]